ncbi:MAG: FecR domain-containing protein [Caulobacteraceae bacterium]
MRVIEDSEPDRATQDAAAEWVIRLRAAQVDGSDWLAFDAWLNAAPEHGVAYDAADALWTELSHRAEDLRRRLETKEAPAPARRRRRRAETSRRAPSPWTYAPLAAAAAGLILFLTTPHRPAPPAPSAGTSYATAKGERRRLLLEDGTAIDLNSASRIRVRFDTDARRVFVEDAEAAFDVAHDAKRPFLVAVGDRTIRVVGTEFNVLRHQGAVSVAVRRGVVAVTPNAGGEALRLAPGQRLTHREGAPDQWVEAVPPDEPFGWKTGRLIYRDRPLAEVVTDLNRYFDQPIRVSDIRTGALKFSGVLMVDSPDATVDRLHALMPLEIARSDAGVTLTARSNADR